MVTSVVIVSHQPRPSVLLGTIPPASETPLFFLTPLLPSSSALFSAMAPTHHLSFQSVTHSFHRDGGCTPSCFQNGNLSLRASAAFPFVSPTFSMRCALFHFPYRATPLFATLTKTAGVCTNSSHFGSHPSRAKSRSTDLENGNEKMEIEKERNLKHTAPELRCGGCLLLLVCFWNGHQENKAGCGGPKNGWNYRKTPWHPAASGSQGHAEGHPQTRRQVFPLRKTCISLRSSPHLRIVRGSRKSAFISARATKKDMEHPMSCALEEIWAGTCACSRSEQGFGARRRD